MKRFRALVLGAGYLAALPLILNAVSVFATAYIIHGLGAFRFGQWAVAASLTTTTAFLTNLGLRPLFVRRLSETRVETDVLLAEQLGVRLVLGVFAATVALGVALLLRYDRTVIWCTAIAGLGLAWSVVWTALGDVLQASGRFGRFAAGQFLGGLTLTAASVVAVRLGGGPLGVAAAYGGGPVVTLAVLALFVALEGVPIRIRVSPGRAWALLHESRHLAAQQLIVTLRDRAEDLLVPKLVGIAPYGQFSAGVMPADRLSIVPDGLATAFFPTLASAHRDERDAAVRTMLLLCAAGTIPLAGGLILAAPFISNILFPGTAAACRTVMQIAALSIPVAGVARCMTAALQATGRHEAAARATIKATVASTTLSVLLISRFGLTGAAVSWLTRSAIVAVLLAPEFRRTFATARLTAQRVMHIAPDVRV